MGSVEYWLQKARQEKAQAQQDGCAVWLERVRQSQEAQAHAEDCEPRYLQPRPSIKPAVREPSAQERVCKQGGPAEPTRHERWAPDQGVPVDSLLLAQYTETATAIQGKPSLRRRLVPRS
eukprot:1685610-Pyramimonas_sp.AAC.2